jgi:hypothetical protein
MESWNDVWIKLQFAGWYIRGDPVDANNVMYVRKSAALVAQKNVDYFNSKEAVRDFFRDKCDWKWEEEKQMTKVQQHQYY